MIVKICGVTSAAEALMCADAGADMIGLNFYPKSARFVTPLTAKEITAALHSLPKPPVVVGVFVNESAEAMKAMLEACGVDLAQLSGDEPDGVLKAMGERAYKVSRARYPALRISKSVEPIYRPDLLLDSHVPGQFGGTGKTADWDSAAELARQARILLAGGLNPANVREAIRRVQPWGVDVASGVERAPGVKDPAKVRQFINLAKVEHE